MTEPARARRKGFQLILNHRTVSILGTLIFTVAWCASSCAQEVLTSIVANAVFVSDSDHSDSDNDLSVDESEASDLDADNDEDDRFPGALLLCGGGPLPQALLEIFFHCGSREQGQLVVIPSASRLADSGDFSQGVNLWEAFHWKSINVLHALDRAQAEAEEFAELLRTATAVWISGGDQSRLSELYQGTAVERELRNVIMRGGVVGGTSAGSAIASRVMISGGATKPELSQGLDLLPNAIIDQHFSQRSRFERLANAVAEHPDRIGIGIDESTGILVKHKAAKVVGDGAVYVYAKQNRPVSVVRPVSAEIRTQTDSSAAVQAIPTVATSRQDLRPLMFSNGQTIRNKRGPLLPIEGKQ
jgi:cyanophycinase